MSVFTIYCHGSGGHREKPDKEIVCFMGRRATGTEYQNYLILDGVGGSPVQKGSKNPLAGSFNWADKNKAPKGKTPLELGGGKTMGATKANIKGHGVEDNARHAVVALANLPQLPDRINLVGWSRGAITCLVIANLLYDPGTTEGLFRQIDLNIFAFDPVAGMEAGIGPDSQSRRLIPPTVKHYIGVLATGENRETFKPQDLSRVQVVDQASSNVMFLPFPGKHSTAPQNNDPKGKEISDICWTLAHRFFDHFGSVQQTKPVMLSNEQMLEAYSKIMVNEKAYAKIKQKGAKQWLIGGGLSKGGGFGQREFAKNLSDYTQHSAYFINEHHRVLFERICPTLYRWLFTQANAQAGLTSKVVAPSHPVGREIAAAHMVRPNFIESLERLGVSIEGANIRLPAPGSAQDMRRIHDIQSHGNLMAAGLL